MSAQTEKFIKGCAKIASLLVIVCIIISLYIAMRSGVIPGLNPYIDERKTELVNNVVKQNTVSGEILDSLGNHITQSDGIGKPAKLLFEECYSHLLEYNAYGLNFTFYDELRIDKKDHIGANIQLTTNNDLQEFCYKQLKGKEGSLIVINSKTGEIMACASRSSEHQGYKPSIPVDDLKKAKKDFLVNRATMNSETSGSIIKIMVAASMLENGMEDFVYDDTKGEFIIEGKPPVHNHGNTSFGNNVDLESALKESVNTYFCAASLKLGTDKLKKTADNFLLGKDIELDFTTLKSQFDLGVPGDKFSLTQAAFGQGSVKISPLQTTFFMNAVLNEGKIMKPYLVKNITNNNDTIYESNDEVLNKAISKNTAKSLKKMLHATAVKYGFDEKTYGKNIYAKTGTSQMDDTKERFHIYYLVGIESEAGEYVVLVSQRETPNGSSSLKGIAKNVVDYVLAM